MNFRPKIEEEQLEYEEPKDALELTDEDMEDFEDVFESEDYETFEPEMDHVDFEDNFETDILEASDMEEEAVGTARRRVNNLFGSAADCTNALRRARKTRAQALAIINVQIGVAITMLRKAAASLKRESRSSRIKALFLKIFRVRPEFVPAWLKPTALIKDRGDVVAARCKRVADLLASGWIKFFCTINSTNCPDCGNDPRGFACSSWGRESAAPGRSNVICLGNDFWDAMKAGDTVNMLATIMHEPFHIYYGKYVTEHVMDRGKFSGIDCILKFVFEANGRVAPHLESGGCAHRAVRKEIDEFLS